MKVKYSYCYHDKAKKTAHAKLRTQLRKVARALRITLDRGMLRTNPGGIAVWGETTLHTDTLYIQADPSRAEVLVRTCESKADYCGGTNRYVSLAWLMKSPVRFTELVLALVVRMEHEPKTTARAMAGAYGIKFTQVD